MNVLPTASPTPTWKTQLQPASFRGVTFGIVDIETVFGRRNVLHEYPFRDIPFGEDLGKKAREFTINGFVIGDNYIQQRNALINAIENNKTPGILIHPTLGIKNVIPTSCRNIFKNLEGGIEYFALTFVEAGANTYPSVITNTQANSVSVAQANETIIQNSFSSLFSTTGLPSSLVTKSVSLLNGFNNAALSGTIINPQNSLTGLVTSLLQNGKVSANNQVPAINMNANISNLNTNAASLVATPSALASSIQQIVSGFNQVYSDNPNQALKALINLFNQFGASFPTVATGTTSSLIQNELNQLQLIDLVSLLTLMELVIAVSNMVFASRNDALNTRNQVAALMETKATYLANNGYGDLFNALNAARIAMVLDITARAATLKTIIFIQVNQRIPALVLAYNQYEDATQVSDIIARNNIINPGFIPSGTQIEVLQ